MSFSREIAPKIDPKIRPLCLKCRGTKNLCGKSRCPIIAKYFSKVGKRREFNLDTDFLDGNSPPSVFIGRYKYPKVSVGPLVPPEKGDTSILSTPEKWFGQAEMDDIIESRGKLARGKKRLKKGIEITDGLSREVERTRYIALSKRPAESEVKFNKKLSESFRLDNRSQPHGPSAEMKRFEVGTMKSDSNLEKIFYDEDLKSEPAVINLYEKGVRISRIQDLFMVGGTGLDQNRRFVPTRWSITAVDDIIGKNLRERIKTYRPIDEYRIHTADYLDNRWVVILTPTLWQYELVEAFYPETTWNPSRNRIAIFGDREDIQGRSEYASLGGCYYAARLAVAEKLEGEKRQAGAIVLREAHSGYILPVGVWNVRESVRNALKTKSRKFDSRNKIYSYLKHNLDLSLEEWKSVSKLLSYGRAQQRIEEFF
ncbi:hypothetical protein AKJ57_00360 [candidate division MSBL1 archaeon SCGC-AAA259A05]|uniref:DNA repair protein n=1 Tax=candidate division MSBL1 archaeon SCGC-AAA259A05 TaxID=1698259 RepID=A0A133UBZ8_9EURY|nr:hypothetical protein AKJ57_00360 [candidate division MSBL1 archaeon SCGC-AAA259A05]